MQNESIGLNGTSEKHQHASPASICCFSRGMFFHHQYGHSVLSHCCRAYCFEDACFSRNEKLTCVPNCIFLFAKDYHRHALQNQFSSLFNILSVFSSAEVLSLCMSL